MPPLSYLFVMQRIGMMIAVLTLAVASCSGGSEANPLIGIRASQDSALGDHRLLFAVHEISGARRGAPDEIVTVTASPLDSPDTEITAEATYIWLVPESIGLYLVNLPFDRAGTWQIDFTISTGEDTDPFLVDIQEEPRSVAVGETAPLVQSPTLSTADLEELTTDRDPLLSLYEISLDDALANGRKTVVIFATPAFCTSTACGPMLEQTKLLVSRYEDVDFLHIEVYRGLNEPGFAPDIDHLAPAVVAFGLESEPWVFVIDEQGVVAGRFDGVLGEGEIESLLSE